MKLPFTGEEWLADACVRRCTRFNQNAVVGIIGPTGTGKSYAGARLGELIDPNFTAARVVFEPKVFVNLINSDLPPASVVFLDEAGVKAGARDWYREMNKALGAVFQSFRFLNLVIIVTVPDMSMTDLHVRTLMHYLIETTGEIDRKAGVAYAKPFILEFRRNDEPRPVYPVFHVTGMGTGRLKEIGFSLPSETFITAYEEKKKLWLKELYAKLGASNTGITESKSNPQMSFEGKRGRHPSDCACSKHGGKLNG